MIKQISHIYKTVIIGNSGVGKSSILVRFAQNQFDEHYLATIGVDFRFKTLQIDGKNVKFQIWDTAGQQKFRTITSAYYRGSQCILLVFDITDHISFNDICKFWMQEVQTYAQKDALLILIGNKSDMIQQRAVRSQQINKVCSEKNLIYIECSAKTNNNIIAIFTQIGRKLMERKNVANKKHIKQQGGNKLKKQQTKKQNKKCCS